MAGGATIPFWHPVLGIEEAQRLAEVVESGFPNDGAVTEEFASRIATLAGCTYGIGVSSGSAALYCALAASGVGPGDEVVVPDVTFIASANAVRLTGAEPVLVDVRGKDFTIDVDAFQAAIGPRTRAVMPVHVNGRGGSIVEVVAVAREHGLAVIEDASEALSSSYAGRPLGSFGDVAAFSFAPTKLVTTGQGGVVVTNDDSVAVRVRELKDQGRPVRGTGGADAHPAFGFNFKLTNLQAAVGIAQLDRLTDRLAHLQALEDWYSSELEDVSARSVRLVGSDRGGGERLAWIDVMVEDRDGLAAALRDEGAEPREFWFPVHTQPPYALPDEGFPTASRVCAHGLWLPSALSLTREDVSRVGSIIRKFAGVGSTVRAL